jgi:hypothetical protein
MFHNTFICNIFYVIISLLYLNIFNEIFNYILYLYNTFFYILLFYYIILYYDQEIEIKHLEASDHAVA